MRAALFDMDGLMLDTESVFLRSASIVGKEMGLADIERIAPLLLGVNRHDSDIILKEKYGDIADGLHEKMMEHQYAVMAQEGIEKKPGIEEILSYLKEQGALMAVVSSTASLVVRRELTEAGLLHMFDVVVGGESVVNSKPSPAIYLEACKRLGVMPHEAVGFEDSYNGIRALHAAGIKAFMIPDKLAPTNEMRVKAYEICDSLTQALEIIKERKMLV